jgi:hypothetical protein
MRQDAAVVMLQDESLMGVSIGSSVFGSSGLRVFGSSGLRVRNLQTLELCSFEIGDCTPLRNGGKVSDASGLKWVR